MNHWIKLEITGGHYYSIFGQLIEMPYGISSIINHQGKVIVSTDGLTAGYVDARISPQTGFTPYVKYADLPLLIFLSLILCLIAIKYFVKVGRIKKIKTTI